MALKTVVLYLKHKVRPETLAAIADAEPGGMIGVEESELFAFLPMAIFLSEDNPELKQARDREARKAKAPK